MQYATGFGELAIDFQLLNLSNDFCTEKQDKFFIINLCDRGILSDNQLTSMRLKIEALGRIIMLMK